MSNINYSQINILQTRSETDSGTVYRYKQFYANMEKKNDNLVILDVGCNTGRGGEVLKCLLNNKYLLFGVDCVEECLKKASKIYNAVLNCYSTAIPLSNESIDCILAGEFIEHLSVEDALKSLHEFYRLLKPNSQILLTTPNPGYLKLKLTGFSVLGGAHLSQYYPHKLKKIMKDVGFTNIIIKGSGRVAKYIGDFWPFMCIYGSYLLSAQK